MLMLQHSQGRLKEGEVLNKNTIFQLKDEAVDTAREFGMVAKKQIAGNDGSGSKGIQSDEVTKTTAKNDSNKLDPVTGKKPPTKHQMNNLSLQVAQLSQARLKKVREELEKQRLKTTEQAQEIEREKAGPEVKIVSTKPKDDAVAKTLKGSKSTGEFKGLIGG